MSRRKKKKHDEGHVDESWLLPYSDLLTLLLALFIVLFASSSVDAVKFQAISKAFNSALTGGTGVFEFQSPMPEGQKNADIEDAEETEEKDENAPNISEDMLSEVDKEELKAIQNKVNAYIEENELSGRLDTLLTGEGLMVSIRDNVLFASGSADVRTNDINIANEIAELLIMDPPRNIIISGHTDNVPIGNAPFDSNWELSVMRAINFMKIILKNDELDPRMFSAKGFGEFQPVASNDNSAGKAKNRRVEILILPRTES
ncbi:chemotaxis protein MotB [Cytobacillus eiseniae]|uniref:Chemotaxis protein MotB n=1 Tax=Cytobacillus eiseniae TaxID=762947 RepID=A0ABS4RG51_9BACI|nr:flagellar motor protein MotB [Cytobacillus eiseniae]MBP2241882.1 chemotaxis protein MotB [Cytobacillus eiseniae]